MWETLWTYLFFIAATVFAGMSVWVTIGGFHDLKRLFKRLGEDNSEDDH